MADMVQAKKTIIFKWHDDEHKAYANLSLPREVVENFFKGETLEFTFYKDSGKIDARQKRKSHIIQL